MTEWSKLIERCVYNGFTVSISPYAPGRVLVLLRKGNYDGPVVFTQIFENNEHLPEDVLNLAQTYWGFVIEAP